MSRQRKIQLSLSIGNFGYHPACWRLPEVPSDGAMNFGALLSLARLAEEAFVDFIFLADVAAIRNFTDPRVLREREQQSARLEPYTLLAGLAANTGRIGLVGTASTTFQDPWTLARRLAALDAISGGRAGWNMVTSTHVNEAQNYGLDRPLDSDARHARAHEFAAVLKGLLRARPDGNFTHHGTHFRVDGGLDAPPTPQPVVPIATAGASGNAQELAAAHADIVYSSQSDLDAARRYAAAVRARLAAHGRAPGGIRIFQGILSLVGGTRQEARDKYERLRALLSPEVGLGLLISNGFPDLRGYPLDEPVPDLSDVPEAVSGSKALLVRDLSDFARRENLTLRQLSQIIFGGGLWQTPVIGTAADIADEMEEWFTTGAADGFNIQSAWQPGCTVDFVSRVMPELRRRGLLAEGYGPGTLRERLGLETPGAAPARERAALHA